MLARGARRGFLGDTHVALQQVSRAAIGLSIRDTVIISEDRLASTRGRLAGHTHAVLELVAMVTKGLGLEDTCVSDSCTALGTEGGPQNARLAIKLGALGTTFDLAGRVVGGWNDVVEGESTRRSPTLSGLGRGDGYRKRKSENCRDSCHDGLSLLGFSTLWMRGDWQWTLYVFRHHVICIQTLVDHLRLVHDRDLRVSVPHPPPPCPCGRFFLLTRKNIHCRLSVYHIRCKLSLPVAQTISLECPTDRSVFLGASSGHFIVDGFEIRDRGRPVQSSEVPFILGGSRGKCEM